MLIILAYLKDLQMHSLSEVIEHAELLIIFQTDAFVAQGTRVRVKYSGVSLMFGC